MFVLLVKTVLLANYFIFPVISIDTVTIQNLTQEQCEKLKPIFEFEKKEDGFISSVKVEVTAQCLRID